MGKFLKIVFFLFIVKPLVYIGLGLNIINKQNLPEKGPIILAANHNSHLDTLVLMALFPIYLIPKVRPVAAADYFLSNRFVAWLSLNVIGIIPIERAASETKRNHVLAACDQALSEGDILIIFPEGSRGSPEMMSELKKGVYHLAKGDASRPVLPVMVRGLGHSLPKGTAMFVPFNCDVVIGEPIKDFESSADFVDKMTQQYESLSEYCITQIYSDGS